MNSYDQKEHSTELQRIAIGGLWHETNTFASGVTDRSAFKAYQFARNLEILSRYSNTNTELGGFIRSAQLNNFELIPTLFAAAVPSGIIEHETAVDLCNELIEKIHEASPIHGIFLSLHGAAVAEKIDDLDGYLLKRVRTRIGKKIPIVATLDYHANVTPDMVNDASVLISYNTYPHVDMAERGEEAGHVLAGIFQSGQVPNSSFKRVPLVTSPINQQTDQSPMREVLNLLHSIECQPNIICGSIAMGFPYCDVDYLGAAVMVYGNETVSVEEGAIILSQKIWQSRNQFLPKAISVTDGVNQAIHAESPPTVIVEAADNIGGGSAGDATDVLAELIRHKVKESVIVIADRDAVQRAIKTGVGSTLSLKIGGKVDTLHGSPVEAQVKIRSISDGRYVHKGSYMTGYVSSMGQTAVVEAEGVTIVLTTRRSMPFDAEQLRCVGIEPQEQKIIVVKSAIAWKAAYGEIANEIIVVESSGVCPINLDNLQYHSRPKPLYPLDRF